MARSGRPERFLTDDERAAVEAAVAEAEASTSGEIRVVLDRRAFGDPLEEARKAFARLGMQATRDRNAVLVFLALRSRRFAIFGDEGVHRAMGQEGWDHLRDGMTERFQQDDFKGGLVYAVREVGRVLREHFPWREGDINELPDGVEER